MIQKQTATTFKGTGRNRGRTCVKVKTVSRIKGGGALKTRKGGKKKFSKKRKK